MNTLELYSSVYRATSLPDDFVLNIIFLLEGAPHLVEVFVDSLENIQTVFYLLILFPISISIPIALQKSNFLRLGQLLGRSRVDI